MELGHCDQYKEMQPLKFGLFWSLEKVHASIRARLLRVPSSPAEPPSEHLLACLTFLHRVTSVRLRRGKQFEIRVQLNMSVDGPESTATGGFSIMRTARDVELLELQALGACSHHPVLSPVYNMEPCALCERVKRLDGLPVKTSHRLLHTTETLHKIMSEGLMRLVEASLVAPTNRELYCEGIQRVPSAVTSFLLRGVDQTKL